MKVVRSRPPNYDLIVTAMPVIRGVSNVMFCYGDTIYSPDCEFIPAELLAHEAVHSTRQLAMGVDLWWREYLIDAEFRLKEEYLAHRAEYRYLADNGNRDQRRAAAAHVGKRLSSALYGNLINRAQAIKLLKIDARQERPEPVRAQAHANQTAA